MTRAIYVHDLPDLEPARRNADGSYTEPRRPCLYCPHCGDTFSATRGDYFWMPHNKPFRCQQDRTLLQLKVERTVYEEYHPR